MHALHFAEQLRQQQAECCFRPTLDAKSVALAEARRQKGLEVHEALVLVKDGYEAKCEERRRQKQQAEEAECTFKPATNERANEKVVARVTQPPPPKEGRQTTLAAHAGRPMLIEVWATWCGPCRKVRSIIKEHEAALSEVATLVGVSVDQGGPAAVTRYLEKSPGPAMLEFMVTPEFRAAIKPLDTQNTIPKLVYVGPDGRIANLSHSVNSPTFMTALLRNLGRTKPAAAPDEAG